MVDRNEEFSDLPFEAPERKKVRGVVFRDERRAWLRGQFLIYLKWASALPPTIVAFVLGVQKILDWWPK